jgi:Tol biopolymer transport system component
MSWSPDGSWLAYQSDRGTVRLVRPDGSGDHLLATGYSIDGAQAAEWSPDNTKLALANDATNAIDLIDVTNGADTRLTSDVGLRMFAPRWSPDGRQILMSGQDALGDVELYLIDAGGTNVRKLTGKHETISAGEWSPDGRQIAYTDQSASDAEGRLYVVNADGTGVRPLKDDPHGQFYGVWSPDGGEIAYNGHDPSPEAWYVAVVDVASGASRRLATGTFPRWSPDGRWIAYADTLPGHETVNPSSGKDSSRRLGVFIIDSPGLGVPRLITELLPAGSFAWRP